MNNVASRGLSGMMLIPAAEGERCVSKCGPGGPLPGVKPAEAYCGGWDASFTVDSNALCLPRSACEALCDSLADCGSFDMHKTLSRCYLNERYCDPGSNPYDSPGSTLVDLANGIYFFSADYDFVYKAKSPTIYKTYAGVECV